MATSNERIPQSELILKAIEGEVKKEGERLMAEAVEKVKQELIKRTAEIVASVTVAVMKMTDYQILQDRVVFTIRTEQKN